VPPESGAPCKNDGVGQMVGGRQPLALPEGEATRMTLKDIMTSSADSQLTRHIGMFRLRVHRLGRSRKAMYRLWNFDAI
jgi:hypothetical protein